MTTKITSTHIFIALFLAVVFIGGAFYMGYYISKGSSNPISELEKSKVVLKLNAFASGKIIEIEGRNITIENGGDKKTIQITETALIAELLPPENSAQTQETPQREEIKFEELKVGDIVNIFSELRGDGSLMGVGIDKIVPQ